MKHGWIERITTDESTIWTPGNKTFSTCTLQDPILINYVLPRQPYLLFWICLYFLAIFLHGNRQSPKVGWYPRLSINGPHVYKAGGHAKEKLAAQVLRKHAPGPPPCCLCFNLCLFPWHSDVWVRVRREKNPVFPTHSVWYIRSWNLAVATANLLHYYSYCFNQSVLHAHWRSLVPYAVSTSNLFVKWYRFSGTHKGAFKICDSE